jgi:Tfp pilus assembly protein PilZ
MKRLLIGDCRESLLSTLEVILKHLGYRLLVSSQPKQLKAFLQESSPDLLVLGTDLLVDDPSLAEKVREKITEASSPLVLLGDRVPKELAKVPHDLLEVPLDIFALFELIQKYLEKIPRKNLRLAVKLPGLLCRGGTCYLAEVLSLSANGLFMKTGFLMGQGDLLNVVFPLFGMKKELEIEGRVLYFVHPGPENNYRQGVGVEFHHMKEEDQRLLQTFIETRFLGDVTGNPWNPPKFAGDHLKNRAEEFTLRVAEIL